MVARNPSRRRLAFPIIGTLLVVAGALVFLFWPQIFGFIEEEMIYRTKARHWQLASRGEPLPGTPDLKDLPGRLAQQNLKLGAPVLVRIFKREFELELWMRRDGRFVRFATYPICAYSGTLGPKLKEGDRQAPEGFYTVDSSQLNPNSNYHRSFNLGYPNLFDQAHGRTGSLLMVHGACASIGCYAMTDAVIDEIWTLITSALNGGQKRFQVQVFPFRMTDTNMASHARFPDADYWGQLKAGYDIFNRDHLPPTVNVCGGKYVFGASGTNADGSALIGSTCPATVRGS